MGFSGYPTGVADRVSGIQMTNHWYPDILDRRDSLATVDIFIEGNYIDSTRQFSGSFSFKAVKDLVGAFKYNAILLEDSVVWNQAGSSGGPNYVHNWMVRDMMNGAEGDLVINGNWDKGEIVSKSIVHNIPIPAVPAPDIRPQHCRVVVFVYKVGLPLNSNAEIQQSVQIPLTKPNYKAQLTSQNTEYLGENNSIANYSVMLSNEGLFNDVYYLEIKLNGPPTWTTSFSTLNGTFLPGMIDSVVISSGEQKEINVQINANAIDGYGKAFLIVRSKNNTHISDSLMLRFVTNGVNLLVVDDDSDKSYETYSEYVLDSLNANYGVLGSSILDIYSFTELNCFKSIIWQTGTTKPALTETEMDFISQFLDQGGNIYLSGLEIPYQLADPSSPFYSQNTIEFFTNYLHAHYILRNTAFMLTQGVVGDSITGNISQMWLKGGSGANIISVSDRRYANQINVADTTASPIFTFFSFPTDIIGIKAIHQGNNAYGSVIFTSFGFETIAEEINRITLLEGVYNWFNILTDVKSNFNKPRILTFNLKQNYPNPFNATTNISFDLPYTENRTKTKITIYDVLGKKVKILIDKNLPAGSHEVRWDGTNESNSEISSGIYYIQLLHGELQITNKMLLLR